MASQSALDVFSRPDQDRRTERFAPGSRRGGDATSARTPCVVHILRARARAVRAFPARSRKAPAPLKRGSSATRLEKLSGREVERTARQRPLCRQRVRVQTIVNELDAL